MEPSQDPESMGAEKDARPRDYLVQHVVVRDDLSTKLGWTAGSVMAQACHASVAALVAHGTHENVKTYLLDLPHMTKAVVRVR